MTDKLVDAIGYDSINMREAMRADGSYMEGFPVRILIENNMQSALVMRVGTVTHEVAAAECEVCHCYLGPHPGDDNHHSSMFETPVRHYCAAHCPACNHPKGRSAKDTLDMIRGFFGDPPGTVPDDDDEQIIERRKDDDDFVGGGAEEDEPDDVDDNGGDDGFVWS